MPRPPATRVVSVGPIGAHPTGQRKQACSGGEPCDRCQKDERPCTYGERDPKTALTRARMNELENRCVWWRPVLTDQIELGGSTMVTALSSSRPG